jgi:hypothetical protein
VIWRTNSTEEQRKAIDRRGMQRRGDESRACAQKRRKKAEEK